MIAGMASSNRHRRCSVADAHFRVYAHPRKCVVYWGLPPGSVEVLTRVAGWSALVSWMAGLAVCGVKGKGPGVGPVDGGVDGPQFGCPCGLPG